MDCECVVCACGDPFITDLCVHRLPYRLATAYLGLLVGRFSEGFTFLDPSPNTIPFAVLQKKSLVDFDGPLQFVGVGTSPCRKAVPPAKCGVQSSSKVFRLHCDHIAIGKAFAVRQPEFLSVQTVRWRPRHCAEGSIAGSAEIALKSLRFVVGHCTVCAAMRAGQVFSDPHFNCRKRGFTGRVTLKNLIYSTF